MFATRVHKRALLVLVALAVFAAACSSDGGGDEIGVQTPTTAATEPDAPEPGLTIADDTENHDHG